MIQEKDFLYRVPVKNALVTAPGKQVRNPEILVDLEGGEFMHGDILDANSTNKLIDQSVKDAIDNSIENGNYVTKDLLEAETSARTKSDEDLNAKIKAEQTRAEGKEKEISDKLAIVDGDSNTEGSFRKAIADVIAAAPEDLDTLKEIADKLAGNDDLHTALNQAITEKADASALANEVSRATGAENDLRTAISAKQDAGSYVPYDQTVTSRYRIDKDLMIDNSKGSAVLSTYNISAISNSNTEIQINPDGITMRDDDNTIILNRTGIILPNGDNDHVLTSNGSTINMANYLKESDVSGQFAAKADRSDLITIEQKVTANTTAIEGKQDAGNYIPYDSSTNSQYSIGKNLYVTNNNEGVSIQSTNITGGNQDGAFYLNYSQLHFVDFQNIQEGQAIRTTYSINGITSDKYNNCLATSDGTFKPISDFALKTDIPQIDTSDFVSKTATDIQTIESGIKVRDQVYRDMYTSLDQNSITINNKTDNEAENIFICTNFIKSRKIDESRPSGFGDDLFLLNENGVMILNGDDNHVLTSNCSTIDITQYALRTELPTVPTNVSQLTNDSNFITQQDADAKYALSATADSLSVGLSKKQDKIKVNGVDVTDIETADITRLRTIVIELIDALTTSGLIRQNSNIE